jgi:release factor glutamine methyltransferase
MGDPAQGSGHTVLSVLRGAETWLQRRGVDAPRRSAELLLGKVLGLGRMELYLAHDRPLDDAERAAMRALVARRGDGEPVAYLLGSWSFRGLDLEVAPAVLIPRPETELLVDHVLARAPQGGRVLDLGTGSGAIAIALASERPDLRVVATDQSKNALAVAAANVARLGFGDRIELRSGDWWQAVASGSTFDVVVSNPPYIDPQAPHGIAADVAAHEPPLALYSAAGDVVSCYRTIAAGLAGHLVGGGWFVAETGVGASGPALALLRQQSFLTDVRLLPDPAGIDRFLLAQRS